MATSIVTNPVGPTYAISVGATQTTAINVTSNAQLQWSYAEFINRGATDVCVVVAQYAGTPATPALVFPVAGTPTVPNSFMLPAGMTQPRIVKVPAGNGGGFGVSAIGSGAGPSIIYITPVSDQS